jgi:hypothetical protein
MYRTGLSLDDANLHAERIRLWENFNHAWLALGRRQRDWMQSGHQPTGPQSMLSADMMEHMMNELIRLSDGIERHGLVDYQYGVWEERIVAGKFSGSADHCGIAPPGCG